MSALDMLEKNPALQNVPYDFQGFEQSLLNRFSLLMDFDEKFKKQWLSVDKSLVNFKKFKREWFFYALDFVELRFDKLEHPDVAEFMKKLRKHIRQDDTRVLRQEYEILWLKYYGIRIPAEPAVMCFYGIIKNNVNGIVHHLLDCHRLWANELNIPKLEHQLYWDILGIYKNCEMPTYEEWVKQKPKEDVEI